MKRTEHDISELKLDIINATGINPGKKVLIKNGVPHVYWLDLYRELGLSQQHAAKIISGFNETEYIKLKRRDFVKIGSESDLNTYPRVGSYYFINENSLNKIDHIHSSFLKRKSIYQKLYIIYNPVMKLYKIGISTNPTKRLKDLKHASGICSLKLISTHGLINSKEIESVIHRKFYQKNVIGEWFDLESDEIEYIYKTFLNHNSPNFVFQPIQNTLQGVLA
jgi:hypothetical protein